MTNYFSCEPQDTYSKSKFQRYQKASSLGIAAVLLLNFIMMFNASTIDLLAIKFAIIHH